MTITESLKAAQDLTNEQQCIAHLKQGNLDGLKGLVQIYQVKAVHAALLILIDQGTAEEVAQEAFLRAYQKIDQFDDRRPFGPWFLRIVIHLALKTAAKQRRTKSLEETKYDSHTAEWLIDPGLDPQKIVENAEEREDIWLAIGKLTPDQRAAVVLRYFLDESEQEMIRELNRPLTTIKWWLHSARRHLQKSLHPFHDAEPECREVEHE